MTNNKLYAFLKEQVDKNGAIDIGSGIEKELGVSKYRLKKAISKLVAEGYSIKQIHFRSFFNSNMKPIPIAYLVAPNEITMGDEMIRKCGTGDWVYCDGECHKCPVFQSDVRTTNTVEEM